MYIKDKLKTGILYFFGLVAIGIAVALIVWFISILHLRTEYRDFCLQVNDAILATPAEARFIQRGTEQLPLSAEALDYYDQILLAEGVTVISRKEAEPNERSIVLLLEENRLIFTNVEKDGSLIHLRWETAEGSVSYTVRSERITFMQMSAYFTGYARRAAA